MTTSPMSKNREEFRETVNNAIRDLQAALDELPVNSNHYIVRNPRGKVCVAYKDSEHGQVPVFTRADTATRFDQVTAASLAIRTVNGAGEMAVAVPLRVALQEAIVENQTLLRMVDEAEVNLD